MKVPSESRKDLPKSSTESIQKDFGEVISKIKITQIRNLFFIISMCLLDLKLKLEMFPR